jgi:hypothetical protein
MNNTQKNTIINDMLVMFAPVIIFLLSSILVNIYFEANNQLISEKVTGVMFLCYVFSHITTIGAYYCYSLGGSDFK